MSNNNILDWKYFMSKYSKVIILLIFVILVSIPMFEMIYLFGIKGIFNYFSNQIIETVGINQYLAKAIVLLMVIPFIWAFRWMFSISSSTRMAGYAIVIGYMVLFYFSMFFFTKNQMFDHMTGKAMKYCAQTPEGLVCFDTPGFDPKYGIELKPVDSTVAKSAALRKNPPRKINNPTQFFDFATREPLIWYYELPDGTLEFYDQPGFHPKYAEQLKPVTPESVRKYEKKKSEEVAITNAAIENQKRKEEIARAKAEAEAKRKSEIEDQKRREEVARAKAEAEAKRKSEIEGQKQREEVAREKAEAEAKAMLVDSVRITEASCYPRIVKAGDTITSKFSYIINSSQQEISIAETRILKFFSEPEKEFKEAGRVSETLIVSPGLRRVDGQFIIPEDVLAGKYIIEFMINWEDKQDKVECPIIISGK